MNPQYSQQPFTGSLPGFNPGRGPSVGSQPGQSFQNVPLGSQKTQLMSGPPQMNFTSQNIPTSQTNQSQPFPPSTGMQGGGHRQVPLSQLPPMSSQNQIPPSQRPPVSSPNQFAPPPVSKPNARMNLSQGSLQNGPPMQFPNNSQFKNETHSDSVATSQPGLPPPPISSKPPMSGSQQPFGGSQSSPFAPQVPGQPSSNQFNQNISNNDNHFHTQGHSSTPPQKSEQVPTSTEEKILGPSDPSKLGSQPQASPQHQSSGKQTPISVLNSEQAPPIKSDNLEQNNSPNHAAQIMPNVDVSSANAGPPANRMLQSPLSSQGQFANSVQGQPSLMSQGQPPTSMQAAPPTSMQAPLSSSLQASLPPGFQGRPTVSQGHPPANLQGQAPTNLQGPAPTSSSGQPPFHSPFMSQYQSQSNQNSYQSSFPGQAPMFTQNSQSSDPKQQFPGQMLPPQGSQSAFGHPSQGVAPPQGQPTSQGPPPQLGAPPLVPPPTQNQLPPSGKSLPGKQKSPYQIQGSHGYPTTRMSTLPPPPGQSNQFGQVPKPSPQQNQFGQGSGGQYPGNMPPMPNQPPLPGQQLPPNQYGNTNHLNNQFQNMNVSGSRPYPGGQMKGSMNGDTGPHMPPPLNSQQGYINGQQMRGPPAPGFQNQGPGMQGGPGHGYPQPAYQQQQQQKRLDPDQMPSPIQVTQDDQSNRSGIFCTNQKGLVPPLVTTNFIVQDQGNSSPRFIRSTMYSVPISQDIMKQTAVPFSLVISPMARTLDQEYPPPIVNFGDLGPVRCIRCKAYMCPFMQFIDSGRRFQCLFCKATTDVPQEYFQHLDHTGQRMDRYERPELVLGTYEFVATADYCKDNILPKPPAIIFVIDVSYNNMKSGLVHLLCSQMKEIIKNLPVDQGQEKSNTRVGFITYNSSVHFYNIKGTLAAPQMMVVGDTHEMFMPLLDGFLSTPEESGTIIDTLMQQIPTMFQDTRETEIVLLPAILAGLEALKASGCAGKLLVFHSSLPNAEAPGKLRNRDDRKLLGTDKEKTVLTPQTQAYNNLGQECVANGCSVDLFIFNNSYIDLATIGQVPRLTGGEIFKYTYFQADIDGDRVIKDIITDISRPIAFDCMMRVRTSTGVRPTEFYGHFYMQNTTDMEIAAIDCDKAVAVEIKHDDKLSEDEGVYIQTALLYTSCSGQRRLRILNLSLKTCSQMADLYRSCDLDTMINYISKQSVYKLLDHNPKTVKDNIINRAAQILATYRKNCASPSSSGQLILPECMKLLPLYVNCLLKNDAISGGSDMTIDDRSFVMHAVMIMDIPTSVNYFYPRLIPIHNIDPMKDPIEVPPPIRCTVEKMSDHGVYILENGIHMFLWIGLAASPDYVSQVFGVQTAIQVDVEKSKLPELDNPMSLAVRTIIDEVRIERHRCMRLTILRPREKLEPVFKHFLVEDRGTDGSASYVDFLCHMHKEIRTLLS